MLGLSIDSRADYLLTADDETKRQHTLFIIKTSMETFKKEEVSKIEKSAAWGFTLAWVVAAHRILKEGCVDPARVAALKKGLENKEAIKKYAWKKQAEELKDAIGDEEYKEIEMYL